MGEISIPTREHISTGARLEQYNPANPQHEFVSKHAEPLLAQQASTESNRRDVPRLYEYEKHPGEQIEVKQKIRGKEKTRELVTAYFQPIREEEGYYHAGYVTPEGIRRSMYVLGESVFFDVTDAVPMINGQTAREYYESLRAQDGNSPGINDKDFVSASGINIVKITTDNGNTRYLLGTDTKPRNRVKEDGEVEEIPGVLPLSQDLKAAGFHQVTSVEDNKQPLVPFQDAGADEVGQALADFYLPGLGKQLYHPAQDVHFAYHDAKRDFVIRRDEPSEEPIAA